MGTVKEPRVNLNCGLLGVGILLLLRSVKVHAEWYLGCYNENPGDRAFNISAGNYRPTDISAQECTSACAVLNQTYATMEGELCFCSSGTYNKYGAVPNASLCDSACSDPLLCGNTSYVRVYTTQDAIGGLAIQGPEKGVLFQDVNFTTSVDKGGANMSYTFDFGDGSYVLTTCPYANHTYTRADTFQVTASARSNSSGPITASTWVSIESPTGVLSLEKPQGIVELNNETAFSLRVARGTKMQARWVTSPRKGEEHPKQFNISDAIVYYVGSSATLGETTDSPDKGGTYVIPSAMIKKDGYIVAWELYASKTGPIRLQIYRPLCASDNEQFCQRNYSCIPKKNHCLSNSVFSCPSNSSICLASGGHCLVNCQRENSSFSKSSTPLTDYVIVAESIIEISERGKSIFVPKPEKAIEVQAGDVIGWVANSSSGALAFESTADDPSFFYNDSQFSVNIGGILNASSNAKRHEIKHVLRAFVSQPSQAEVNWNYKHAGLHKMTVVVDNAFESELKSCEVSVQERIENVQITSPSSNLSYATGENVSLTASVEQGSNISFYWTSNNQVIDPNNAFAVFHKTGWYPISVQASNNISSANVSTSVSILDKVVLKWLSKPQGVIDAGMSSNFSFLLVSGTNVTVSVSFGDGTPVQNDFYETAQNTTVNISHIFAKGGKKQISVMATNRIQTKPIQELTGIQHVKGKLGSIRVVLRPEATVSDILKISTNQEFEIAVSTSEPQPVNYTFKFSDELPEVRRENTNSTKVTHMYPSPTDYNVTITATIAGYSEATFVHVIASICGAPRIFLPSSDTKNSPRIITKATPVELRTRSVEQPNCPKVTLVYQWNIYDDRGDTKIPLNSLLTTRELQSKSFLVEPGRLNKGNYSITLNISYSDEKTRGNNYWYQTYIQVVSSSLVVLIKGGSYREVDPLFAANLILDASSSYDPDNQDSSLIFTWECQSYNSSNFSPPSQLAEELCSSGNFTELKERQPSIAYNCSRFRLNATYTFKVTVSEGDRTPVSAQQVIRIIPNVPSLEISCQDCQDKINPQERLTLKGDCTNCGNRSLDISEWTLLDENSNMHHLSGNKSVTTTGWNNINLVIKAHTLREDTTYIVMLRGKLGSLGSRVKFRLQTTSPPRPGTCSVFPSSGIVAEEKFFIECNGWTTSDNPMSYEFRYQTAVDDLAEINTLPTSYKPSQLWHYGDRITPSSVLPLGNPQNDFQLKLFVRVYNKYLCFTDYTLQAKVLPVTVQTKEEYKELEANVTEAFNKVDAETDPQEVVQWVNSVSSIINYDNKTDEITRETRESIRTILVNKLATINPTDLNGIQHQTSAVRETVRNKFEVTSKTQKTVATIFQKTSSFLKKKTQGVGPVKVEEVSQILLTAVSDVLEASDFTTYDFIQRAIEKRVPTTEMPSRKWSGRIESRDSEEAARDSKEVLDLIELTVDDVGDAVMSKRVLSEKPTLMKARMLRMKLQRSLINKICSNVTSIEKNTCDSGNEFGGQFILPDVEVLLKAVEKDVKDGQLVDSQVVSFSSNPFRSDEVSSPYIHSVTGFSLRTANKDNQQEIPISHLEKDVEIFLPTDVKQVSESHAVDFEFNTLKRHRYQLNVESPIHPLMVHVKPENGERLLVFFRAGFEASHAVYDLKFPVPFEDETLPVSFRKIDNFTFMLLEPISTYNSPSVYFSLAIQAVSEELEDSVSRTVHVNYTAALFPVRCMYWSPAKLGEWREDGCKVGDKTTFAKTHCLCNHLTFFGSLNLKPNPIGPPTLAKFKRGYALFGFVCAIFLLYFLGLIWARRKDKADVIKVGVCPLRDNDPSDPYRYELTLWTGMRRNAGTRSKISLIVYGDESESEARMLDDPERTPFQRGSLDTFLLTTPCELGSIQFIRVWHDNTAGSWFLSRIMVIDLQTEERYFFICNRWLAVDEEDGQIERLVPLASKQELTEFGHLFIARTRRNLSDGHLWFSVLARPANSRFTRVQRLSCCLCLLLMSMVASGMYYDRQDEPGDVQYVGSIVFTWNQVAVGIISSLIVFPVNLILVQIFRNVRRKPKVRSKQVADSAKVPSLSFTKENLETYNQLKDSSDESNKGSSNSLDSSREKNNRTRLSINDVHTDVDRASFTDSPLLRDRRLSTTDDIAVNSRFRRVILFFKRKFTLPYYFIYVAWALVSIFSIGSALCIVLYGMEFGNEKSLQWLFASCVSFVQDVLITQPLKVLGLAIFFALVVKKPDQGEFEITEDHIKLAEDEEFLHQSIAGQPGEKTVKTKLLPPDRARLIAMRNARMKELKMYSVIREIATFYVFLSLLLIIAYTHRDPVAFYQTNNFVNMMARNFSKITRQDEFWGWTHHELLQSLFPSQWYNGQARQPDGFMADGLSQMVGGARLRLLRIKNEACMVPTDVYGITNECYGEYFIAGDDTNDYTVGWYNVTTYDTPITRDDMPWRYQNGSQLDGYPFWATLSTYSGGGYVIVLEPGMNNLARLKTLQDNLWVERHTRAILTEFTIYNAQTNMFCVVTLVAEFPAMGAVIPHVSIQTMRLYDFTDSYMFFVVSCEVIFVVFILFFAYHEAKRVYKRGIQAYFKEFWNSVEFGIITFAFAAIGLYVYRALNIQDVVTEVRKHPFKFKSFQFAAYWDESYTFILAIIVLLGNIKLNKLLRFNKRLSLLSSTLKDASFPLMMFSIVWGIVFVSLTLVSALVFGSNLPGYRSVIASFTSLFSLMLGRTAFLEMEATNRILGPLFFFVFTFLISMVLVNMFLSIVIDSFRVVQNDTDKQSNEYEMVDFIMERFKLWSGIGRTRRPHSRRRILWDTAMSRVKAFNAFNNRPSITIAGLHMDTVSELEDRLEKLIDRTDVLYGELFPEKQHRKVYKGQVNHSFVKGNLLEAQVRKI